MYVLYAVNTTNTPTESPHRQQKKTIVGFTYYVYSKWGKNNLDTNTYGCVC